MFLVLRIASEWWDLEPGCWLFSKKCLDVDDIHCCLLDRSRIVADGDCSLLVDKLLTPRIDCHGFLLCRLQHIDLFIEVFKRWEIWSQRVGKFATVNLELGVKF